MHRPQRPRRNSTEGSLKVHTTTATTTTTTTVKTTTSATATTTTEGNNGIKTEIIGSVIGQSVISKKQKVSLGLGSCHLIQNWYPPGPLLGTRNSLEDQSERPDWRTRASLGYQSGGPGPLWRMSQRGFLLGMKKGDGAR